MEPLIYNWSLYRLRMNKLMKTIHEFTRQVIKKYRQKSALDNEVADIGSVSRLTESMRLKSPNISYQCCGFN